MLRFILVTAAYSLIKYSKKMKMKYLSIVRRIGKNSAMVAIARIQLETIYVRLSRGVEFNDQIEPLSERKQKAMVARSRNPVLHRGLYETVIVIYTKKVNERLDFKSEVGRKMGMIMKLDQVLKQ